MDSAVVTGDYQGYVHFIDKETGALAARVQAGKTRISTAPIVAGDLVVVVNDRGQINAYKVGPLSGGKRAVTPPPAKTTATPAAPAPEPAASEGSASPSPPAAPPEGTSAPPPQPQ
jgi:hypothetical protein